MTPLPFATDRTELALILELLGEKRLHVRNSYSAAKLESLGVENISEALARRQPGKVQYLFERSSQTEKIAVAYFDQIERNKRREATEKPNATDAELTRFAVSVLMMRKAYVDLWKTATVHASSGGESTSQLETHTVTKEDIEANGGRLVHAGKEYREGDKIIIGGTTNVSAFTSVGVKVPKELREEVGF